MLKLGMLDFDTSHVVQFAKRLNSRGVDEDQFVDGAVITLGCPGESKIFADRIPKFTKVVSEECGVTLVDRPEDLIGQVDGVLIESNDGSVHLERAAPFIEAGVPLFIDKPLAWSLADAEKIVELADKKNVPIFSVSSLRYCEELVAFQSKRAEYGAPLAAEVYGCQIEHDVIPGWYFYGIHSIEILFALLGPGCGPVQYVRGKAAEHTSSKWENGALGMITMTSEGKQPFGFTYHGKEDTVSTRVDTKYMYRNLLREVVTFFETGKPGVPLSETLEIIKFLDSVNKAAGVT